MAITCGLLPQQRMAEFGADIRKRDFYLADGHIHINHGSYGAVPKPVQEERMRLMAELEGCPDTWFRFSIHQKWPESRRAAADFLGANLDNLVLVTNATTGCNAVVKSLPFKKDECILLYNYTYKAVANACKSAISKTGGHIVRVELPLKLDKEIILSKYREALQSNPNIKLVVLDLIASCCAILFPIRELTALCKEFGALVLVDAAHGPGQVDMDLENMGAHFVTGNFHKWVFTPRGCAALWVHPDYHDVIRPAMTSHGYHSGSLQGDFFTQGTVDNTAFFSVAKAIEYYHSIGGMKEMHSYSGKLLDQAVAMLTKAWGTEQFPVPRDLEAPYMRLVQLPKLKNFGPDNESIFCDMTPLMRALTTDYHITTVCLSIQHQNWVRLSANVYNTLYDYEQLRDAILDLQEK